jgi:hypothetical protein
MGNGEHVGRSTTVADGRLQLYIQDYLIKRGMMATANSLVDESGIVEQTVPVDVPGGILQE